MLFWLVFDIFVEDKLVSHFIYCIDKRAMVRLRTIAVNRTVN